MRASVAVFCGLCWLTTTPAQQPAKPPALPPINPAAARLDQTITGLDGPGFGIAYSQDLDLLVASCENATIQSWKKDVLLSIRTGSGSAGVLKGHEGPVLAMAWNGGPVLASSATDRKLLFWSISEGKVLHTKTLDQLVRTLAMSPDGKLLASAGDDPTIQLWDVDSAKPTVALKDHKEWVIALAFSPDGKQLASAAFDGTIRLWDVADAKKVRDLPTPAMPPPKVPPEPTPIHALAFSPDGKTLAAGGGDGLIQMINVADGKVIRPQPGHTSAVTGLAFHPSGTTLASSSKDRTIRLWNLANGQVLKALEGHTAWVEGVVFTTQGTRLASVGADRTVRIWDLTEPPKK